MRLQGGPELVEGDEWTEDVHIRALLAAGPLRFVDGGGQLETDAGSAHVHRLPPAAG